MFKMRYSGIFVNVLVVCFLCGVCVVTSWSTMDRTCKQVALGCLDSVGRTNFIYSMMTIYNALDKVVFNFSAVANKTLLEPFCSDVKVWTECFTSQGCVKEEVYVRQQLYPVHILCEEIEDFLASPSCWEGKVAVNAMLVCIRGTNSTSLTCNDVHMLVECIKYTFKYVPECSDQSKRFVGALLDEFLKYDAGRYCENSTVTV